MDFRQDPISEYRTLSDVAVDSGVSQETIMTAVRYFKVKIRNGRVHESDARMLRCLFIPDSKDSLATLGWWDNTA